MNFEEMVTFVRDQLKETSAAHWTNPQIGRALNSQHQLLAMEVIQKSSAFFLRQVDLNLVANQSDYNIPALSHRIHRLERVDGTEPFALDVIKLSEAWRYRQATGLSSPQSSAYSLLASKFRIFPTPASTVANALTLYYIKRQPSLHSGTAAAGSTTTITFPLAPAVGSLTPVTDAYEGMAFDTTGGTGSGQRLTLTAYNAATRVGTFAAATALDATTTYAMIPEMPEQWHDLVCYGAAMICVSQSRDSESKSLLQDTYNRFWLACGIDEAFRQEQAPRRVNFIPVD